MACGAWAGYGHSSSYVHIDHQSHGLGAYDGGYDHGYDDHHDHHDHHDYHVSSSFNYNNASHKLFYASNALNRIPEITNILISCDFR